MKEKTCCFTGHRELPEEQLPQLRNALFKVIVRLAAQGVTRFACGGALGFDTLAAQMVLVVKEAFPQIELLLVLPCKTQDKYWPKEDQEIYREILARADRVVFVSETYIQGCMQKRNRLLVEGSSVCVCYCTKKQGGTVYTLNYASLKGLEVINLAEKIYKQQKFS